jgi:hypothetical protein
MALFTKIVDPYNTMGAVKRERADRDSARQAKRAGAARVKAVARKYGLTLEAAAEFIPAADDAMTYGVSSRRGGRAAEFCHDILNDRRNRKDWY